MNNVNLNSNLNTNSSELLNPPIFVPYIRFTDYALREAGWYLPSRKLLDYLLIYIQEGTCLIEIDEQPYTFREGDFCLIQPNQLCTLRGITNTITPYVHFDLFFNPLREQSFMTLPGQIHLTEFQRFLQPNVMESMNVHIPGKFTLEKHSFSKESLLKMIGLWQNGDELSRMEAHQLLGDVMIGIIKALSRPRKEDIASKPQSLNWITAYLSYSLSEKIKLSDMARRARLSPSRFSTVFKQKFGITPHQYLLELRIHHAQELLKNDTYTLEVMATYCGFSDAAHFSKAFKLVTQLSPGQYRKAMK